MPFAITAATPAFSSMARSFSLSPTASVASRGIAQMVGQRQQTLALVYSGGGDFDVVGRPLHHLDALDGRITGQRLLRLFHRV